MNTTDGMLCCNRILYTKDGSKIGNAIIIDLSINEFSKLAITVKTDYGS